MQPQRACKTHLLPCLTGCSSKVARWKAYLFSQLVTAQAMAYGLLRTSNQDSVLCICPSIVS